MNGARRVNDRRNDLVFQFLRFVQAAEPKTVMLENVPGLVADSRFDELLDALRKAGYEVNWDILNAADYAVPQRRKRLILLASRFGKIHFAPRARKLESVANAFDGLMKAGESSDRIHDFPERRLPRIQHLIESIPKNGGSRTDLPKRRQLKCHRKCNGFKDVYGRMSWDDVAPTITTGCFNPSKGRFLHPDENRNITMREAALLQSFPRDYQFAPELGKQAIASMIGNAFPPEFIRRHANQIHRHLERHGVHSRGRKGT